MYEDFFHTIWNILVDYSSRWSPFFLWAFWNIKTKEFHDGSCWQIILRLEHYVHHSSGLHLSSNILWTFQLWSARYDGSPLGWKYRSLQSFVLILQYLEISSARCLQLTSTIEYHLMQLFQGHGTYSESSYHRYCIE